MPQLVLEARDNPLSRQVAAIVAALSEARPVRPRLTIVCEGDRSEPRFRMHLVEDRANFPGGNVTYAEYMSAIMRS